MDRKRCALTEEQEAALILDRKSGMKVSAIAAKYYVSQATVSNICKRAGLVQSIAEKASDSPADAPEQEAANITEEPAEREGERGRRIPDGVREAVRLQIGEICRKALRLTEELEELNQQRDALEAWLCEMEEEPA